MTAARCCWVDYEHLRLTIERLDDGWQVFVYDRIARLVIYRAHRLTVHGAKVAAVEFALIHLGTPDQRQDPEVVAEGLKWKPIGRAAIQ
jgi:hypothetical protein